jgi:hypothetical protein
MKREKRRLSLFRVRCRRRNICQPAGPPSAAARAARRRTAHAGRRTRGQVVGLKCGLAAQASAGSRISTGSKSRQGHHSSSTVGCAPCLYCFNRIDAVRFLHRLCPSVQQAQHHFSELQQAGAGQGMKKGRGQGGAAAAAATETSLSVQASRGPLWKQQMQAPRPMRACLQPQARGIHVSGAHQADHGSQGVAVGSKQVVERLGVACR